jgi:hypothetical protein
MLPDEQQERVRLSFAKQGLMTTLGATLDSVSPGMVEIALTPHPAISQQHGCPLLGKADIAFDACHVRL